MPDPLQTLSHPIPIYCVHTAPHWAPLSLGMILAYAQQELDPQNYQIGPFFVSNETELEALIQKHGPGICLFSNYMWTSPANLRISKWVKVHYPQSLTIHGGPDTPAYPDKAEIHLKTHRHIDFTVRGEGEQTLVELLKHLSQSQEPPHHVAGLSFLANGKLIQTAARKRADDLSIYPSPFLTGIFDAMDAKKWLSVPFETNRGCPYGCTFCDWGSATLQKIRSHDLERLFAELEWLGQNQISEIWITDANFGIFQRDVEITRKFCDVKNTYSYPRRVTANYAKNTKKHLVNIVEMLIDANLVGTGIVSLQTRDQATLKAVNRSNIKTTEYDKLKSVFEDRNLPMSTQLMIGLPGSHRESFKEDLRFFLEQDIDVQIFRTVVLPNSPMAHLDYQEKYQLVYDEPGLLLATKDISLDEMLHIELLGRLYRCTHTFSILRYWLLYLKWDHGIDPIQFLDELAEQLPSDNLPPLLKQFYDIATPHIDILNTHMIFRETMRKTQQWKAFYQTLKDYTLARYPQLPESELDLLIEIQAAVMPELDKPDSFQLEMAHDFLQYYQDHWRQEPKPQKPLHSYASGILEVTDPLNFSNRELQKIFNTPGQPRWIWELPSGLNKRLSKAVSMLVKSPRPAPIM